MLAHFSHHLLAALVPPLSPSISKDFNLDETQLGLLGVAFNLPYGLSQLPAGWLADRIGARALITVGISGVAVCGFLVGLSSTYIMMLVFLALLGVMGGGYHPAASPLVSASVEEKNQGRALGLHQVGGTASFFLTPLIAVGIASALGGWRSSFITLAIPTMLFGIVLYILLGRRGYTKAPRQDTPTSGTETPSTPAGLRQLVSFIVLGVVVQVLLFSTLWFIPQFTVHSFGVSQEAAAVLLSLYHSVGLWAGPLGGYLADRTGKVPVMLAVSIVAGPLLYLLNLVSFGWSICVVLLGMAMCQYISMPISEAYIISRTSERNRSTILGIYYAASRGGPGVITGIIGYLIVKFDFGTSFGMVGAVMLVVTLVCSVFLWGSRD